MTQPDLLTVAQAARLTHRHPSTIRRLIQQGILPATKRQGPDNYLVSRHDLLTYLAPRAEDDHVQDDDSSVDSPVPRTGLVLPPEQDRVADMPSLALFSLELAMTIKEQSRSMLSPLVELLREKDAKLEEREDRLRRQQETIYQLQAELNARREELDRLRRELDVSRSDEAQRAASREDQLRTMRVQLQQAQTALRIIQTSEEDHQQRQRRWWPFG